MQNIAERLRGVLQCNEFEQVSPEKVRIQHVPVANVSCSNPFSVLGLFQGYIGDEAEISVRLRHPAISCGAGANF
jgi:hypothetical protein